ncbi:MAG: response regulator [Chloroflexota bacterium]
MAENTAQGRVLIIDDDIDFLETAEAVLAGAGYEVTTARSGEEGVSQANGAHPDVIILDLMLEHPDAGFTVAHTLKNTPELASVPIIMVTAVAREAGFRFDLNSEEARKWIKVERLLNKPIPGAELVARVREATAETAH